jgi:L-fucose dehydrogenase
MHLGLENKVIIVTGGSKGIGSGIVTTLAQEGALPIIIGRDQAHILEVVKTYSDQNLRVGYAFAELTDPDQCEQAVRQIRNKYGAMTVSD